MPITPQMADADYFSSHFFDGYFFLIDFITTFPALMPAADAEGPFSDAAWR